MNDELNNNQSNFTKPIANDSEIDNCAKCGKNPCVCPDKSKESGKKLPNEKPKRTKPPKISWI